MDTDKGDVETIFSATVQSLLEDSDRKITFA